MDDERMLLLSLSQIEGLGNKAKKALLFHFGSAIRVFSCTEREVKGHPPSHEILLKRIIESGAVMSEFPPGTKPLKNNYPVRNRLISGLSERVVIVEAGGKERFAYHCGFRAGAGKRDLCLSGKI